jgi:ubiquinone/menaquinone biosynthesis C-methylase UbiE
MTEWVLTLVFPQSSRTVLDIGCGGGAALLRMAELAPQAELHGVDYSPQSLEVAERINRRLLQQGRVFLREADVSALPYDDGHFDVAMAMNSHYFWPELEVALGEIMRVLRPHGLLVLAGGEYFGGKHDKRNRKLASNGRMNFQTLPELRSILSETGYSSTAIHEEWGKGWFCAVGHKPGTRC